MIPDDIKQEPYMNSRSYDCIHEQLEMLTGSSLQHDGVGLSCYVITTTELLHGVI